MKEETGYNSRILHISPIGTSDPGCINTNLQLISLELLGPRGAQALEGSEHIEVLEVPLSNLLTTLHTKFSQGDAIDARLMSFAEGFQLAQSRAGSN